MPDFPGSLSWVLEIKLMSSCLQGKPFTNRAISSVLLLEKLDKSAGDRLELFPQMPLWVG